MSETTTTIDETTETTIGMTSEQARELIANAQAKAEAEGKSKLDGIKHVPPIAFTARIKPGVTLGSEESFLKPIVEITPTINPLFHALMTTVIGARPDGARSYSIPAGEKADPTKLEAAMEVLPGGIVYSEQQIDKSAKTGFHQWNSRRYKVYGDIYWALQSTAAGQAMNSMSTAHQRDMHPDEGPCAGAAIILTAPKGAGGKSAGRIRLQICTNKQEERDGLYFTDAPDSPDLDRFRPGNRLDPQSVTPDAAITILEEAAAHGYTIVDPSGDLKLMRSVLAEMVVAQRVPGAPGAARLVVGAKVSSSKMKGVDGALPAPDPSRSTRSAIVDAKVAAAAVAKGKDGGAIATILDPAVQDVITMAEAEPVEIEVTDESLTPRHYQKECVGLHLATRVGLLNACSPGLGKTPTTLWGMRAWAERNKAERAK